MTNLKSYDTEDMGLAVALGCLDFELVELGKSNRGGKRIVFRFTNDDRIEQAAKDYWSGKLMVNAKRYWNETKNLKTRLYSDV